jgi:GNAT superfamily N-acetyltransferase
MRDIFNDAWKNNWNFVPFTREEFQAIGKELLMLLPANFIQIAEIDGEAASFVVLLPNINEAIADLDGRLLPFGWAKLLWRLKVKFPKTARVALMGVRQKYQNTRFGPALAYMVIKASTDAGTARGLERAEMSWVLEHNHAIRHIIESIGGEVTKRYRMYEKKL